MKRSGYTGRRDSGSLSQHRSEELPQDPNGRIYGDDEAYDPTEDEDEEEFEDEEDEDDLDEDDDPDDDEEEEEEEEDDL